MADPYRAALLEIARLLKGGPCDHTPCEGCRWEWEEAERVAKAALAGEEWETRSDLSGV